MKPVCNAFSRKFRAYLSCLFCTGHNRAGEKITDESPKGDGSPAGLLFWFDKNQAQIADPGIGNSLNTTTMIGLPVPGKVMSAAVDLGDAAHQARGKQSAQARKQAV